MIKKNQLYFENEISFLNNQINDLKIEGDAFKTICTTKEKERILKMDEYFKKSFEKDRQLRQIRLENTNSKEQLETSENSIQIYQQKIKQLTGLDNI